MQAMRPGEITPAHKHTASAHRFIMEGRGAYTVVDGHPITLGANDYVLTPNGCWHDHGVDAEGAVSIWQDGLDIPLMNCLETNFYAVRSEEHTSELQSLMRISYAVFCLKKKNNKPTSKQQYQSHS